MKFLRFLFGEKKFKVKEEAGIILGYELSSEKFRPVFDLASKGKRGWKMPLFIKDFIQNPAVLLLNEHWYYDKVAVNNAFTWLKNNSMKGVDKLEFVFKESKRFEPISVETLLSAEDDVDIILEVMKMCEESDFRESINPLERAYGHYAYPDNYQFERMNAAIIWCMSEKFPKLYPIDDSLRSPVYEYLGTTKQKQLTKEEELVKRIARVTRDSLFPIPKFQVDWDPAVFVKLHKSKGAKQLRELIRSIRDHHEMNDQRLANIMNSARSKSMSLSPTRNVVYAFGSLGAAILSAIQAIANPYFYIPASILAALSADQFYMTLTSRFSKEQLRWLDVADQLAEWCPSQQE